MQAVGARLDYSAQPAVCCEARWEIKTIADIRVALRGRRASSCMQMFLLCSEWVYIYNTRVTEPGFLWDNTPTLQKNKKNKTARCFICTGVRVKARHGTDDRWEHLRTGCYLHCHRRWPANISMVMLLERETQPGTHSLVSWGQDFSRKRLRAVSW